MKNTVFIALIALVGIGVKAQNTFPTEGNVGIGTTTPYYNLDLKGNLSVGGRGNYKTMVFQTGTPFSGYNGSFEIIPGTIPGTGIAKQVTHFKSPVNSKNGQTQHDVIFDGNVGIGTTSPDAKLTVAGEVKCREVKVTVDAGADFVFEDGYQLKEIEEVETFIKENGHLPEIAPAYEMETEGMNVSEMNIKLLQKIEELTLYLIEQDKKQKELVGNLEAQQEEIQKLNHKINQLKK